MENQQNLPTDTARLPANGQSRPAQLSSNMTLFWRVFVPVFGTVFFASFLLVVVLTNEEELYLNYPALWLRLAAAGLLLGWAWFVWRTLWRLKRLDADDAFLYVTNYWITVRYPWTDVARFEETRRMGRRVMRLWLLGPGRFGQKISFLPGSHFHEWLREHDKQALLLAN